MRIKTPYFYINIEPLFLIVFFIFLMSVKIQKMLFYFYACYLFIIFHELSHMCVASIFGKEVKEFKITMSGVCIILDDLSKNYKLKKNECRYSFKLNYLKEILTYAVGPFSNLFLALLFRNNSMIFEINILFFIINLIPIYPLDGYNIVRNICYIFTKNDTTLGCRDNVEKIINLLSNLFFAILIIFGVLQLIFTRNITIIIFIIYLFLIKSKYIKNKKYDKFIQKLTC